MCPMKRVNQNYRKELNTFNYQHRLSYDVFQWVELHVVQHQHL